MKRGKTIKTRFQPARSAAGCDWSAVLDAYGPPNIIGYGPTETAAVADLLQRLDEAVDPHEESGLDSERRWQAMANLTCEAEKFYLQHDGKREWDVLMDETNRILDLDDATLLDNLSERRADSPLNQNCSEER